MKAAVTVLVIACLVLTAESYKKKPWRPRPCIDCYGNPVPAGVEYYDGCNTCRCATWFPFPSVSFCTYRLCKWSDCPKKKRPFY